MNEVLFEQEPIVSIEPSYTELFSKVRNQLPDYPKWMIAESVAKAKGFRTSIVTKPEWWNRTYLKVDYPPGYTAGTKKSVSDYYWIPDEL